MKQLEFEFYRTFGLVFTDSSFEIKFSADSFLEIENNSLWYHNDIHVTDLSVLNEWMNEWKFYCPSGSR